MGDKSFPNIIGILFSVILLAIMVIFVIKTQTLSISNSFVEVAANSLKSMASDVLKGIGESALSMV